MTNSFLSQVSFHERLPRKAEIRLRRGLSEVDTFLLIYDRYLDNIKSFRIWKEQFRFQYPVIAGEKLKSMEAFSEHIKAFLNLLGGISPRRTAFVSVGGGSVGDFVGFCGQRFQKRSSSGPFSFDLASFIGLSSRW